MPVDYEKIREEYRAFDDPKIRRFVRQFVVDSYADRAHFIFELIQNAEDAIGRRENSWRGDRAVSFLLTHDLLRVSHFGDPFNEDDVRGICGIGDSTKGEDYTAIGRFGIGFKSVYSFTDRPEVHSGDEDFVIENFVSPTGIESTDRDPDKTVFLIPLDRESHIDDFEQIATSLAELGARSLLFLRHIDEIRWEVDGSDSGHYLREERKEGEIARRINVIGHATDLDGEESDVNEEWLVFSRRVQHKGNDRGHVEIAFKVDTNTGKIQRIAESKLVVYFPTIVETHVGFLVQGPYRTTPNRDNAPMDDHWNQFLVQETAELLSEVLVWLRHSDKLDVNVLESLPITRYSDGMFDPLFDQTKATLLNEDVLPRYRGSFVSGNVAALGDSEDLRRLLTPAQLSEIFGQRLDWLIGSITGDRSREVWTYLTEELGVREIRPEYVLRVLTKSFLMDQSDEWMVQLYEFLATRRALHAQCMSLPLIRLEDGDHVTPQVNGGPSAYLPSTSETGFPTVKRETCRSAEAVRFFETMGIKPPNVVDDVIKNVLAKYEDPDSMIAVEEYQTDVNRIVNAFGNADSEQQRRRLVDVLSTTPWVRASDTGHGRKRRVRPSGVYLATERVKNVFSGVSGVLIVDEAFECLTRADISELLAHCGATVDFTPAKFENGSRFKTNEIVQDWRVLGLGILLETLDEIDPSMRDIKARLLWESMSDWREDQTWGTYKWSHRSTKSDRFDSEFIEQLSNMPWIPGFEGELKRPAEVDFDALDWIPNPTLQSRLPFKPSEIKILAQKLDFEPDVLELLKRLDLTTVSKLREVGIIDDQVDGNGRSNEAHEARDDGEPFAKQLFHMQSKNPTPASDRPILIPDEGPKTATSAKEDALQSKAIGGSGTNRRISVSRWTPTEAADTLAARFKQMVYGDYGKRCQVCSNAFTKLDGEMQVFVMHIVPLSKDGRANNFGDLIGVCGWHHALIKYGEWQFDFPTELGLVSERETFDDWQNLRASILAAQHTVDKYGNTFVSIPIQFSHVFREWASQPANEKAVIRYSVPHWKYLCELLKV